MTTLTRSPVYHHLEKLAVTWGQIGDCPIALTVGPRDAEVSTFKRLALCDASALPKLGLKGPKAEAWLRVQEIPVPMAMFGVARLADGGVIVRVASNEFFLESGPAAETVPALAAKLKHEPGLHRLTRQDATFLVSGQRVHEALLQTCGIDLARQGVNAVIYTRVAGVSCAILPEQLSDQQAYRIWVDYTYADYLWEELHDIMHDLGGGIVGAGCFYLRLTVM